MEQTFMERNAELHPKCRHILKAGPRKGLPCLKRTSDHVGHFCTSHDPSPRLVLSAKVLALLREGHHPLPHIGGEGEPPIERGYVRMITPSIAIVVEKVHTQRRHKQEPTWWIKYALMDGRRNVRNLRRTGVDEFDIDEAREAFAPENFEWDRLPVLKNSIGPEADGSYTARGTGVIDDAGEAPPAEFMNELVTGAVDIRIRKRQAALEKAAEAERELLELADDAGTTSREKKHIKEIAHHVKQLNVLAREDEARAEAA